MFGDVMYHAWPLALSKSLAHSCCFILFVDLLCHLLQKLHANVEALASSSSRTTEHTPYLGLFMLCLCLTVPGWPDLAACRVSV